MATDDDLPETLPERPPDAWFAEQARAALEAALLPEVPHDPDSVIRAMMSVAHVSIARDEERAVAAILEWIRVEIARMEELYADAEDAPMEVYERAERLLWISSTDEEMGEDIATPFPPQLLQPTPEPDRHRLTVDEVRAFLDSLTMPGITHAVWKPGKLVLAAFFDEKTGEKISATVGCTHEGAYEILAALAEAARARS